MRGETNLALDKVPDSGLGHDGDRDGGHDLFDHFWVRHAGYAALGADICWDALGGCVSDVYWDGVSRLGWYGKDGL